MKVKFYVDNGDGISLPKAKSDRVVGDCDLFDLLLSGDLSNVEEVDRFESVIFKDGGVWWFNAAKVTPNDCFVTVQAAFDMSAETTITLKALKMLIVEWKKFLVSRSPVSIDLPK